MPYCQGLVLSWINAMYMGSCIDLCVKVITMTTYISLLGFFRPSVPDFMVDHFAHENFFW